MQSARRWSVPAVIGALCALALLAGPATAAPPGLVAGYGFEEADGTAVADVSVGGNNGTVSGAVRTASGRFGQALTFDGVNDIGHGARRQLARPHQRHDARGLGAADRARQLPHRDHQGDDRRPRLRAVLELDGVRERQRERRPRGLPKESVARPHSR